MQICNIGHSKEGAFRDGNDEDGDYGECNCRTIPGQPEIFGTKEANLSIKKIVSDLSPSTGDNIVFTITVTNDGLEPSNASFVRDQLASGFYYLGDDLRDAYYSSAGYAPNIFSPNTDSHNNEWTVSTTPNIYD